MSIQIHGRLYDDSRADNSRDERSPWKLAILAAGDDRRSRTQTSTILSTARSTRSAIWSGEDGDGDEGTDEAEIQEHQTPPDQLGLVLKTAAEEHGDKSVKDRSGENTNNGTIG